jgi:outer membrane protein assembly complex protein YaeT
MDLVRHLYATRFLSICLLCFAVHAGAQEPVPTDAYEGRIVTSIRFEPETQPLEKTVIDGLLPLHTGLPFEAATARAAIEKLYATGRYQDIQIDAEPEGAGVALRLITQNSWFFGHMDVQGDISEPPNVGQILSVAGLTLGQPFDESEVSVAVEKIRELLIGNGYFHPAVSYDLAYENAMQQVQVTFRIQAGRRAHYTAPVITGDTSVLDAKAIEKATPWPRFLIPGYRGITQTRTRVGIDKIRLKFQNQKPSRLMATVTFGGIEPGLQDTRKPQGTPHIAVNPGPAVEVKGTGAHRTALIHSLKPGGTMKQNDLTEILPIFEEGTVDGDLLAEGAANLRDYFQVSGYSDVKIDFVQQKVSDQKTEIEYTIQPGERHRLVSLVIKGNKFFDEKTIRERMLLLPKSFEFRRGRYSEVLAARDKATIEDLYRSNGFRDVHVTTSTEDDFNKVTGDIAVFFTVEEGPQYRVSALAIIGAQKVDLAPLMDRLSSQEGQAFSEYSVASDRETILNRYGAAGYSDAVVEWDWAPGKAPATIDLSFIIHEGQPQFVREVAITGLSTTRLSLVNAQVNQRPGDPLSASGMAETQRRLYDLGIFSQVNMAVQNPDGAEERRYVIYDLQEASRYSLTVGAGTEFGRIGGGTAVADLSNPAGSAAFSPHVSLSISRLNFLGLGQTVGLQLRYSTLQKRASASYFVPRIFNRPKLDASLTLLYDDTHDVNTYHDVRREISGQVAQRVTKALTAFYRYSFRNVDVSDLKISPLLLPRLTQSVRVGIASVNLVHDRRDDPTDPHRGIYSTLDVGLASKYLGSQTDFVRILGRNATYYRLGTRMVFARETQFGVEPAFNIPLTADPSDPIPLPERFYGGGGNTHRGFSQNQAGPRDLSTGFPLGGSALFFNSTELRFPLLGANIHGVLFEDFGNVFSTLSKMSFRVHQKDETDFDYMVHAVGFGVRYRTPLGPLRLDLAYGINPPKFNGFPGSYSELVTCSARGTCVPSLQQVSHFNFFFSIGQAF